MLVGALTTAAASDIHNVSNFKSARNSASDAAAATNDAIQEIRYQPLLLGTLNASPPGVCWGSGPYSTQSFTSDSLSFDVWCSTAWDPASAATRVVTFSTCFHDSSSGAAGKCAAAPVLQAVVTFDDYPTVTASAPETAVCVTTCGTSMTVNSWIASPVVPSVVSMTPSAGPITGGTGLVISGANFGATSSPGELSVNFVEQNSSGTGPSSDNVVVAAQNVNWISPTQVSATAPAVIQGTKYYVTVSSPNGTSAYSTGAVFSYTLVAPQVSSLTLNLSGNPPTTGGNAFTISGHGFTGPATVTFTQVGNPSAQVNANYVNVVSSTQITAVSPSVISGSAYYVTVTTAGGTSTIDANNPVEFTYTQIVPSVTTISQYYGPGSTTIQISGSGFYIGDSVSFVQEVGNSPNGNSYSATNVQVISATQITATSPAGLPSGYSYFVIVNATNGSSSPYPIYNYLAPTISSVSPTSSASKGPSSCPSSATAGCITITGTGFDSSATVTFTPYPSSHGVSAVTVTTGITVNPAGTQLILPAPSLTINQAYEVTVNSGTTGLSSAASTSYKYTYT